MKKKKTKTPKKLPDLNYLLDHYRYDPLEGVLYKIDPDGIEPDKKIGWKDDRGYWHVKILKQTYKLHRIAFYMFHRRDPGKKVIDHIDGDKGNNTVMNLRCVTQRQNQRNTAKSRKEKGLPKCERGIGKVWV